MTLVFAALVFLLPGLAWHFVAASEDLDDLLTFFIRVFGMSAAWYVLLGLGTFVFNFQVTPVIFWILNLVFLCLAAISMWKKMAHWSHTETALRKWTPGIVALVVFITLVWFRFQQAESLVLPAWVDSVHHTLIVRVLLEQGQIPDTLNPFIDVPFYYHFGFHAITAAAAYLARLSPENAVLQFGQILNAAVAGALYVLIKTTWKDWRRGLVGLLLVGFVFQMPAYYLTWGRYTLLTGTLLLLLAMNTATRIWQEGYSRRLAAELAILTAATLCAHYLSAMMLALFFTSLVVARFTTGSSLNHTLQPGWFKALFVAALTGGILALPWLWRVWQYSKAFVSVEITATAADFSQHYANDYLQYYWNLVGPYRSHVIFLVGICGLFLFGWKKEARGAALWSLLFILVSLPWGISLKPFRPDHGAILFFLPAGLFAADLFVRGVDFPARGLKRVTQILALAGVGLLLFWGARDTRNIINPVTVFATQEDLQALAWINANIPAGSQFFINVTPWQSGIYRGVDGGYWIPVLTDSKTLLPPAIFVSGEPEKAIPILETAKEAASLSGCDELTQQFLIRKDVDYLYLKTRQGPLRVENLFNCTFTELVFSGNETFILRFLPLTP